MTTEGSESSAAALAQLRQEVGQLRTSLQQSSQEVELLRAHRQQLLEQHQQNTRTIEQLQHQLQCLLRRFYGQSAEKIDPQQMLLFKDLLEQLAPPTSTRPAAPESATTEQPARKGHGRRRLPADLPRRTIIHDLPEEEKCCPHCGEMRQVIGREVTEQIDYVPPKVSVLEHQQLKYGCRHCEQAAAESGPQITTAEKPLSPIEKGLAAPGLLAYVIVSKYGDHLPLYRLERILDRYGINISRSTMGGWMAQSADALHPLYDRLVHYVRLSNVIHTDDTPVDVLDPELDHVRTGRFWVYVGDALHPYTVFTYTPNRSRDGPIQFLKGWSGYLQADAFGGYDGIYAGDAGGRVIEVACWAHARRYFYEARKTDAADSTQALAYVRLLYDVEDEAKKQFASQDEDEEPRSLSAIRYTLRQEFAVPRLASFKEWLESLPAERGGSVLPKSPMGQAITYALNQWEALCVYTANGDLAIDNNASENANRRVALGRKNWLFCGSDNGGNTAAILFSFIASCQRHEVDPYAYLRDVLTRLPGTPVSQLHQLLPDHWKAARAAEAALTPAD